MRKTIISDTSCLIILSKIKELDLLCHLYGEIYTTPEIAIEFGEEIPNWIIVKEVMDKSKIKLLELQIDKGESSAIALALETVNSALILDDNKARKIANSFGLKFTGTIGVVVKAKLENVIPSIQPIIEKIKATNFRISDELERQAYIAANEIK